MQSSLFCFVLVPWSDFVESQWSSWHNPKFSRSPAISLKNLSQEVCSCRPLLALIVILITFEFALVIQWLSCFLIVSSCANLPGLFLFILLLPISVGVGNFKAGKEKVLYFKFRAQGVSSGQYPLALW